METFDKTLVNYYYFLKLLVNFEILNSSFVS